MKKPGGPPKELRGPPVEKQCFRPGMHNIRPAKNLFQLEFQLEYVITSSECRALARLVLPEVITLSGFECTRIRVYFLTRNMEETERFRDLNKLKLGYAGLV